VFSAIIHIAEVDKTEVLAVGASLVNNTWKWLRPTQIFNHTILGLKEPPQGGDCLGVDGSGQFLAYNCTIPKRVLCE